MKLRPHSKMVSYDATALFPSVPISDALKSILELLENDDTLPQRTKLTPYDIIELAEICLSTSNFTYNNRHHTTNDSGPIGLSLMVTISQIWMSITIDKAIKTAKSRGCVIPRNIFVYMDDMWCTVANPPLRQGLRNQNQTRRDPAAEFNDCLNSVHKRVQFTREEEEEKSIAFLDVFVTRQDDGTMTTRIYRKPTNTNIGIKPQSCQDPKTAAASFKGELCRCYRLCSTIEQAKKEIEYTLNLYEDNGHNRAKFKAIADTYTPPTNTTNKSTKEKQKQKAKPPTTTQEKDIKLLFDALPFQNEDLTDDDEEKLMFACISYIPEISHQIKRSLSKAGINTTFTSAPKLKDILCNKNKTQPPKERKKGIYKYTCTCSDKSTYIGQTGRSYETRWQEHANAVEKEKWQHSGISQHYQHCQHNFDINNFTTVHNMQGKNKSRLAYDMRIREALEIRHYNSGPGRGLNEDMGAYVKTDIWDPVLNTLGK